MIRVRTVLTGVEGSPWYVNMHFGALTEVDAVAARQAVGTFWTDLQFTINAAVDIEVERDMPVIDPADGSITAYFIATTPLTVSAVGTSPLLPLATQGLIRLNTGGIVNNRRVQGRILVPGMQENGNLEGQPEPGLLTSFFAAANKLVDADLVVWSRPVTEETATPTNPPRLGSEHVVTAVSPRNKWAVLRSRRD